MDTTPPTVSFTSPPNGALQVTTSSNVAASFSEPMNPLTLNTATFLLTQGGVRVAGTVTSSGSSATFIPTVNLAPNTTYTAVITNVAADLAGNALGSTYQWTFTTGTGAELMPVCLANFAILSGAGVVATGQNVITGDIGVSPGTLISGFPPGTIIGAMHAADAIAAAAMVDVAAGYLDAFARSVGPVAISGDIGGRTFTPGLYKAASSVTITSGDVTLDAKGNANAVFIFQVASSIGLSPGRKILLTGGAQTFNVFWQVGTSASLGAASTFQGNILANQSITVDTGATVFGRLLAKTGTVTLQASVVTSPAPYIAVGGIFNAASWSRPVAPGSIAAVFGNNFGSSVAAASSYPLPTTLGGATIRVGAQAVPLFMTACNQMNLQIPWEAVPQTQVPVTVSVGGQTSIQQTATVVPFAPGIFSVNMLGSGQAMAQIWPSIQLAAPAGPLGRPVIRGEYIIIFGTGLGTVSNQPTNGAPALSNPLSFTPTLPIVMVGGVAAKVTYSGLAPGFAGLYQVNAVIPLTAPAGPIVELVLTMGGIVSNVVTIAVQ
ncbi:MAG: ice-binding family protein [Acidobacteriota bacterium]